MKKSIIVLVLCALGGCTTPDVSPQRLDRTRVFPADQRVQVVLENAIDSEIPGVIVAIVQSSAFAVMPDNTRLLGYYERLKGPGDTRLSICVNRAIRPDGLELSGPGICLGSLADSDGRQGLTGTLKIRGESAPTLGIPAGTQGLFVPLDDLRPAARFTDGTLRLLTDMEAGS